MQNANSPIDRPTISAVGSAMRAVKVFRLTVTVSVAVPMLACDAGVPDAVQRTDVHLGQAVS